MKVKLTPVPQLSAEDLTDREALLLQLLGEREERIQQLVDEIARLKGEKGKPKIKPSRLEPVHKAQSQQEGTEEDAPENDQAQKKRPGSEKRQKTVSLTIHQTTIIKPTQEIPPGSEFKGYKTYTVQGLVIKAHNIQFLLERWKTPTGEYLLGKLSEEVLKHGHLGIVSDGAGQFRLLEHGLCWVHAERLINKLIPFTLVSKTSR